MATTGFGQGYNDNQGQQVIQIDAGNKLTRQTGVIVSQFSAGDFETDTLLHTDSTELTCGDDTRTYLAWIYRDVASAGHCIMSIYPAGGSGTGAVFRIYTVGTGTDLRLQVSTNGTGTTHVVDLLGVLNNGLDEWMLVGFVHDPVANEVILYTVSSTASNQQPLTIPDGGLGGGTSNDFTVGSFVDGVFPFGSSTLQLDYRIDKVAVYNKVFSPTEILNYYNNGVGLNYEDLPFKSDLISFWELDEATGTTRLDSHGTNDLLDTGTADVSQVAGLISIPKFKNIPIPSMNLIDLNSVTIEENDYFSFDGIDQVIRIEDDLSTLNPQEVTISMWARRTGTPSTADALFVRPISLPDRAVDFRFAPGALAPNQISFCVRTVGGTDDFCMIPMNPEPMFLDTWVHLALVLRGSVDATYYVNGDEQTGSQPLTANLEWEANQYLRLGGSVTGISSVPADIANFEIETRAYTAQQVLDKYNVTKHRFN